MQLFFIALVGLLYAAGLYLMLHRSFVKLVLGMVVLANANNLFLFTLTDLVRGEPAFVNGDAVAPAEPFADPLPQALILTAIVIGFGIQAFVILLLKRTHGAKGTGDLDELNNTDEIDLIEAPRQTIHH